MTIELAFAGLLLVAGGWLAYYRFWVWRARRPIESGFPYVRIHSDGSARELSPEERAYLNEEFEPTDGGRPHIKSHYEQLDGWKCLAGFIERSRVPSAIPIEAVNPEFDQLSAQVEEDELAINRSVGDIIEANADGSVTCTPNPDLERDERFRRMRIEHLKLLVEQERLAIRPKA